MSINFWPPPRHQRDTCGHGPSKFISFNEGSTSFSFKNDIRWFDYFQQFFFQLLDPKSLRNSLARASTRESTVCSIQCCWLSHFFYCLSMQQRKNIISIGQDDEQEKMKDIHSYLENNWTRVPLTIDSSNISSNGARSSWPAFWGLDIFIYFLKNFAVFFGCQYSAS